MNGLETASQAASLRQQTALARFGELALRSEDLDRILFEACRLVGDGLGTDLAKVMELAADGLKLTVRAGIGWKPGVVGEVTIEVADHTSEGHALKTGKPLISANIETETRFKYPLFLIDNGVQALANVVIIGADDGPPFGILQVDSRDPREFDEDDIAFLQSYANLIAAGVERLRSRDVLEARVAERTVELRAANDRLRVAAAERELAEDALRQSHKMEAVGQLTGGIAHDFNNMLHAIGGNLDLIDRRIKEGRTEEAAGFVSSAIRSVNRAAALTNRLLAFARRQVLQPSLVQPNALVFNMIELIQQVVGPGIMVELRAHGGIWAVLCDPNQLENVLLNLAINARDAMPQGGTITIGTRDLSLLAKDVAGQEGAQPGHYVQVSVADTGAGMDEATRRRAFEPFFTTKPLGEGTGLGLSQIYGFARQSGGMARLDSAPGLGTTVRVFLPRHIPAQDTDVQLTTIAEPGINHACSVALLVEDEDQVRAVIKENLQDLGYTVLEARDGAIALDLLHRNPYARTDLLVTDLGLPGELNGWQVADAARMSLPDLPVIFITGYAGIAQDGRLSPGMTVIGKPFNFDTLAAGVRTMIPV